MIKMKPLNLKKYGWLFVIAFCAVTYFSPYILYVAYSTGLLTPDTRKSLNVDVRLGKGWFPIASSSSLLGQVLISKNLPPTVIFYRCNWTSPWKGEDVYVSKILLPIGWIDNQKTSSLITISGSKSALVSTAVTKVSERQLAIAPEWNLSFSFQDISVLNNIEILN